MLVVKHLSHGYLLLRLYLCTTSFFQHRTFTFCYPRWQPTTVLYWVNSNNILLYCRLLRILSLLFLWCHSSLRNPVVTGVDFFDGLPHSQTFHLEFIYLCTWWLTSSFRHKCNIIFWFLRTHGIIRMDTSTLF